MKTILTTTGTSLLTNTSRELKKPQALVTDDELRHFFEQVGAVKASAESSSLLKIAQRDDEVVLLHNTTKKGQRCAEIVQRYCVSDDGSIRLLWADNEKAVNITVQTTARGQAQTIKVCDRLIRPLLGKTSRFSYL